MSNVDGWGGDKSLPSEMGEEQISMLSPKHSSALGGAIEKPGQESTTFMPGDLLANRYRIASLIACGGMGEVYEAVDLELQKRIAIKTVLPAIARDPKALTLLKSEVLLSLEVTHPNVCRIFNLDCHRYPSAEVPPIWFVAMELVEGHTLSREIRKAGKLTLDRALPIAEQMASGLEAARKAKVVHGDFKSGNVILSPSPDGSIRAVITDFGLALSLETARTSRAAKIGTPAYMAPEQVTGDQLSPQTDVYSFGVVLYEMVTGQWPFNANTPDQIAAKRLTEAPTPPVRFVPNLDPAWNRAILKCLARDPGERYAGAMAAIDEITGRSRFVNHILVAVLVVILSAFSVTAFAYYKQLGPFRPKPEVAVMGWRNMSGDAKLGWISTELSERIADVLRQRTADEVIPQQEVDQAKIEFSVPADKDLEQENLSQFRAALGANAFIVGSYEAHNDHLLVDGLLQSAKGQELVRFHEEGPLDDIAQIASRVVVDVSSMLDTKEVTKQQLESSASVYPKSPEARMLYFEALERLRSFDADSARTKLQQVVALEDGSVAAHTALAEAWFHLKYDRNAAEEGRKAVELAHAQQLPPELVQATEARYAELQNRWSDAAQRYKALHEFFPSQLDYSLRYATALTKNGEAPASLQFLSALAKSPKPVGDDPRIQVERAEAFDAESDFAAELNAANQSLSFASTRGEKLMQAEADLQLCWAQHNLGHPAFALDACETARSIFSTFDDTISAAVALNGIANIKMQQGDYRGAKQAYQQVLEITQKANAETDMAGALLNLGKSEIYLGDTAAESHLQKSIELAHRIEDHGDEGKARVLLGSLLQDAGKKQDANEQYTAAYDISAQAGDPDTQAYALSNLGQLALDNNDYPKAEEYLQSALDLRQKMNETDGVAKLQIRLADLFRSVQKISSARSLAEKARATAEKLGDMGTFADALCVLAEIDLSSGDYNAGLEKAAKAAKLYEEQKDTDGESQAHILSARALLAAHDRQKAAQEITFALALPGTTGATRDEAARISRDIQHGND